MIALLTFIRGSFVTQVVLAALLALAALKTNNAYQQWKGASAVTAKIQKKADENVKAADDVRAAVKSGARGMRHPYTRP